ncbi:hypothetical protein J2R99_001433 [Rhodopseudomonas julia]|uniref:Lipid A 3-O-deacylase n=1 Tax=Rhodopseudomonas julia TaxID=200617 RepID=A0ABU0C6K6_9BRAD|nr:acyloxyacyl hydrolase [Rhodopseudomonas julia]MDQ0325584.1 hypothetical protein [Rhodopseudomonas julia]
MRLLSFGAGLVALFGTSAALAADLPAAPADPVYYAAEPVSTYHFFDEVRIGATGFLDDRHRLTDEEEGVFLNGEVLFGNPMTPFDNRFVDFLLRPRPHIGGTVTTSGGTNQVYAGLTWDYNLTNRIFLEGTFGGTIHDGNTDHVETGARLGCSALFRESAGIGVNVTQHLRVIARIDHSSNAGLCDDNDGLTHAGVMVGYKF